MIAAVDVAKRVQGLEELTYGLSREVALWRQANDPLLYLERRSFLNAIQDALAGVETARVVLAKAHQRLAAAEQVRPNHVVEDDDSGRQKIA